MERKDIQLTFTVTNELVYDQRMIRICRTLANHGYSVLLIGREKPNCPPLENESFQQHRFKMFFNKGKFFYLEYTIRCFLFLLRRTPDIYCPIDLDTLMSNSLACLFRKRPIVFDSHEFFTEVPELERRPRTQKLWRLIARRLIPKVTVAYTVGPVIASALSDTYAIPFEVIRNLPFGKNKSDLSNRKKIIIYQGALNEGRGLEIAIESMQHLPDYLLWLVGEGDCSTELRNKVESMNLSERVIFKGFVKPVDLHELTTQATLGINLLEDRSKSYYFSLANKVFDYIQAGVPYITMDFPEYASIQKAYNVSTLLKELSVEKLVAAINSYSHEKLALQQASCDAAAKEYNWENESIKLIEIYERIIN